MCGKGGGSPPVPSGSSTAFQSTVTPNPAATPMYTDFLNRASSLSTTPFNPGMYGQVAPMNALQSTAGGQLFNLGMNMGNFEPAKIQEIMSPYTQNVVGATQNWFNNQNAIQSNDLMSQAIRSGNAFGGDRAGVAEGVLAGQQQLAQAPVIAGLYQSGYGQALDEYNRLKQMGMTGAGAAMGYGSMLQAQQQREFDVAQQNAMMASAYPFQTLNWYGAILGGIAPLLGSQAVGYNTPPNPGGAGFKRGGMVLERRKQAGLVPVFVRHNGGIIAGLAYGGSTDDDDEDKEEKRPRDSESPDTSGEPELPERERAKSWGSEIGQLQTSGRGAPTAPSFAGGTPQQPQSTLSRIGEGVGTLGKIIDVGAKVAPFLAVMSDPSTKTDVQRVGKTDDGDPLYAFRYRGDPKSYPKVVGPMARPMGGTIPGLPRHYDDGGEILSDESEYPIEPGQQYARDYAGRATWFNPRNESGGYTYRDESGRNWTDYGAMNLREGKHASGLPSTTRGFATPGSADLGNWFEVDVGGRKAYAQKTDIGPPNIIDLNAPLAASMGFNPGNVSGRATVRDLGRAKPAEAGSDDGTQWPDPSKGNVIPKEGLPSGEQPDTPAWRVPGAQQGRAPAAAAGPDGQGGGDYIPPRGMGPVGGRIPGAPGILGGITDIAKEGLRNPLVQLVGGYLSGTSPWGRVNLGNALLKTAGIQEAQRRSDLAEQRQNLLDQKPELIHTNKGLAYKYPDGTITHLGMKSEAQGLREAEAQRRAGELHAVDTEKPGPYGTTQRGKGYYTIDAEGNRTWAEGPPTGPAAPQAQPLPPPTEPAPREPATGVGNAPVRQTEVAPDKLPLFTSPEAREPLPQVSAPQIATAGPAGALTAPDQGADPKLWANVAQAWQTGAVKPGGTPTNQVARNEDALSRLTPQEQRTVKDLVDYKIDPNRHFPGVKNAEVKRAAIDAAKQYDPSYDPASFANKQAARKAYEATGVEARNFQSNDMAMQHLGRAMDNVEGLNNIGGRFGANWVNELRAGVKTKLPGFVDQEYKARLAMMQTDLTAVSTELAKSFRGAGALAQREIQDWEAKVSAFASPEELRAVLREGAILLHGRLNANASRYNDVMGPSYARPAESWLSPKGQEALERAYAIDPKKPIPSAGGQQQQPQQQPPAGGPAGGAGWMQDPATGNWKDPSGRIFDRNGKPLQ